MEASDPRDPFAGVAPDLREAMQRHGFEALTAVQRALVASETCGRDLRISSETGSGKTAALGLLLARDLDAPTGNGANGTNGHAAPRGPQALVIAPTRELAMQVRGELDWLLGGARRIAVGVVTGGSDPHRERRMLAGKPSVLVATPGRLLDHLRSGGVCLDDVRQVALDEADRMLDMGFKEDLDTIVESLPAERRSHLMSATFPQQVRRLADRFQTNALHVQGTVLGEANADIQHVVHVVRHDERYAAIVNMLLVSLGQRTLVFVERRSDAAQVAEMLSADGFSAAHLSGELAQAQRTRTLEAFRRGHIDVLVATDVAARGLDVTDIAIVVHADLPADAESYTHRSGRTGRAGQQGRSVLFTSPPNAHRVEGMLRAARVDASWAPAPTAKQVHKAQRKRHRAALHGLLGDEARPTDDELEYASNLLEDRDPAHVVAALLRLSDPGLPCEPRELTPMPKPHAAPPERHRSQHGHARPQRRPAHGPRGRKPPHARRTRS